MEDISETVSTNVKSVKGESVGFFNYVFNFDDENKCDMMNLIQYTLLAIIPILILLKVVKQVVPEEDDSKGSLEILVECIGQIVLILGFMWIINKTIRYIPTYSGCEYEKFLPTNFIIPFLIILITMQTKLGAKFNILIDRASDYWNGTSSKHSGQIRVSQPLSRQNMPTNIPQHQPSQSDYMDQLLPSDPQLTALPPSFASNTKMNFPKQQHSHQQQGPDFSQMYQSQPTPLIGANQPPNPGVFEPTAANDGGSPFSSW